MSSVLLFLFLVAAADADQLRFSSARQWSDWQLPLGAVEIAATGSIQPVRVAKNTNAALDALQLGGGIHRAGSNPRDAHALLDGNSATGWAPNPDDDPDDWFVEIDLGRSVSTRSIALIFADDAPPFELFDLLLSSGEPQLDQVANPIEGSLLYRIKERFKENARHRVAFAPGDALYLTPIRFLQIRNLKHVPDARLVAVEVESIGDNLTLNLVERGGAIDIVIDAFVRAEEVTLGNALNLVDGSIFDRWRNGREPRNTYNTWSHITIDLGAVYPVDFVRLITGIAIRGGFGEHLLRTRAGASGARSFSYKNYEVLTSDGTIAPDGTRIWTRHFTGYPDSENHRAGLADHQFPTLPARYVRIAWLIWDATCAATAPDASSRWGCYANGSAEEIQVYGEGYPLAVRLRSPLIDLGGGKNLNSLEWQAQTPLGTHIEIRSRTGNEVVEQHTFYDKNGKEVTQRRYDKLIPSFKGRIDTTRIAGADWSPWSNIYSASGDAFQSPSPRRFMELDVRLVSDSPTQAAHFDWLAVNFSDPLASEVVGEVFPLQVAPGQETLFSYFLRPATTRDGFDQIAIEATTAPRFDAAFVDGEARSRSPPKTSLRAFAPPSRAASAAASSSSCASLPPSTYRRPALMPFSKTAKRHRRASLWTQATPHPKSRAVPTSCAYLSPTSSLPASRSAPRSLRPTATGSTTSSASPSTSSTYSPTAPCTCGSMICPAGRFLAKSVPAKPATSHGTGTVATYTASAYRPAST